MSTIAEAIMDAAELRMRGGGFNGFSFREIADDVGIKSSSVHYHFPTKEKLAAAVVHRYADRLSTKFDRGLAGGAHPQEVLTHAFRGTVRSAERMCPITVLGAGSIGLPEEVAAEVKRFFQMCLDKLIGGGLVPGEAAELLATITGGMVVSTALDDIATYDLATIKVCRSRSGV
ncbi:TetR/AcrR family transcriptional regulator [Bradyrhizobium sp. Leo121]|uniref:TetR/AcrR family transcriptional regulator n=1 Tax=Bradyrhizobium sp. Leo121 TaxID=1571195 RepID=UPI0010299150|nr:TetR/AcrR family transcriptional regulator [Bradyrhizobium sp. Leo121]RZN23188.1 TetR/AcrR family transcriptional regulator [Bradyrhizobium sp. Leo121]